MTEGYQKKLIGVAVSRETIITALFQGLDWGEDALTNG